MVLQPVDLDGFTSNALGASEVTTETSDPALTPRAWYKSNPDRTVAKGLEDTLHTLKDVLSRDHYVVSLDLYLPFRKMGSHFLRASLVLGVLKANRNGSHLDRLQSFSQGAAMAALLAALVRGMQMAHKRKLTPPGSSARETTHTSRFLGERRASSSPVVRHITLTISLMNHKNCTTSVNSVSPYRVSR